MRELMKPSDVAERLQVSKPKVYQMIERGELESTTIGERSVRVFADSVEKLIAAGIAA